MTVTLYNLADRDTTVWDASTPRAMGAHGTLVVDAAYAPRLLALAKEQGVKWSAEAPAPVAVPPPPAPADEPKAKGKTK